MSILFLFYFCIIHVGGIVNQEIKNSSLRRRKISLNFEEMNGILIFILESFLEMSG